MPKVYEKLYRLILRRIAPKVPEKRLLVPFTEILKLKYFSMDFEGFLNTIRMLYNIESFRTSDDLFLIDDEGEIVKIQDYSQAEEFVNEGVVEPRYFVRYWPTVPPHFSSQDLELADKLNLDAIASFTKEGAELHIFMVKGDWPSFKDVRRNVVLRLLNLASEISLSLGKEDRKSFEPDEINYEGKVIRIFPHIEAEKTWKRAINLMTFSYLSEEVPQYIYLKLTL